VRLPLNYIIEEVTSKAVSGQVATSQQEASTRSRPVSKFLHEFHHVQGSIFFRKMFNKYFDF